MRRRPGAKLGAYVGGAAVGLLLSLATGRPELAAVAAPMLVVLLVGFARSHPLDLTVVVGTDRDRAIEGDEVDLTVRVVSSHDVGRCVLSLRLPPGLAPADPPDPRFAVRLVGGVPAELRVRVRCERWGAHVVDGVAVRATDVFGLVAYEAHIGDAHLVRVFPAPDRVRRLIAPVDTRARSGGRVARIRGEGIELADLRPFRAGDRARSLNWRATARRGTPYVTERHAEREGDVVLLIDAFSVAGTETTTLDLTVRAASTLAAAYLRNHDRVGIVTFGGYLRWVQPGNGDRHAYRIAEALLDTTVVETYVWKTVDVIPSRTLPAKALVVALTPLLDERMSGALVDLRRRGYDLAVVELDASALVAPGTGVEERLAFRLWRLQRQAARARAERLGVAVAAWDGEAPLPSVIEEVETWRRRLRTARA